MTKTEMTEQELADMGVTVFSCPALHRKAIASSDGFVGLGNTEDSREARTILEHEKQHFKLAAFYAPEDTLARKRSEAQVHRALILELCPKERLLGLLRKNFSVQDVADTLEITEHLVQEAFAFYRAQDPHFCCEEH